MKRYPLYHIWKHEKKGVRCGANRKMKANQNAVWPGDLYKMEHASLCDECLKTLEGTRYHPSARER